MKKDQLTLDVIREVPMHDAELHRFASWKEISSGTLCASLDLKFDETFKIKNESYPSSAILTFLFNECRLILSDFKGGIAGGWDTISSYEALSSSNLLKKACEWPPTDNNKFTHLMFKLNSGSHIDIIAKSFFLTTKHHL
jgi:hypothetical protein